jgi:hypothetical protein
MSRSSSSEAPSDSKTRPKRTLPQLCATICINEVFPREAKHKVKIPPEFAGMLARREFNGEITRKELRAAMDRACELLKDKDSADAIRRH